MKGSKDFVVAVQPSCIIDHVTTVDEKRLREVVRDEIGGSHKVSREELQQILFLVGDNCSKPGGSAANLLRCLQALGSKSKFVGACGDDDMGKFFCSSMENVGVDMTDLVIKKGSTSRCCILSCDGHSRTMRPCFDKAATLSADDLCRRCFDGCAIFFLSAYCFYYPDLVQRAVQLSQEANCQLMLDLASFEIVKNYKDALKPLIESGAIDICFCNEDEAREAAKYGLEFDTSIDSSAQATPEDGLRYLSAYTKQAAVVTLGEAGCLMQRSHGDSVVRVEACKLDPKKVVDTTGAGDCFAAGVIWSMHSMDQNLETSLRAGSVVGAAVVQCIGAEIDTKAREWMMRNLSDMDLL